MNAFDGLGSPSRARDLSICAASLAIQEVKLPRHEAFQEYPALFTANIGIVYDELKSNKSLAAVRTRRFPTCAVGQRTCL